MLGTLAAALLTVLAGEPDTGFADHLYSRGEFAAASTEYLRVIYENGGDTLAIPMAALRLARCRQEEGRSLDALTLYGYLSERLDGDQGAMALMGVGSVLEEVGALEGSRAAYLDASVEADAPAVRDRAMVMAALMLSRQGLWEESAAELEAVHGLGGPLGDEAATLAGLVSTGPDLPSRSPFWCGLASAVIPGSGQIICGNLTDGLIALGVNGMMGFLIYESVRDEDLATSVLTGWLGLSFYGGNVYGGARAARSYNGARRRELLEEVAAVLEELPSPSPGNLDFPAGL